MTDNPFTFGNPIKDPSRFYGRESEIRQIVSRLLSSAHESTSLVGERRIGKTSLLNYVAHPQVAPGLGLQPERYCLVYIDFQGLTDITPLRFWQRALSKVARAACDEKLAVAFRHMADKPEVDVFDLEDLFESASGQGLTIVLLLDEFEYVTQNPRFGPDFFGGLRALAIHHGLALITATRRELIDLCHSDEIKGSPFFNIFANVVLRPFSPADVGRLLDGTLAAGNVRLGPDEKALVTALAGGHPLFVQMAGYYLVEGKSQGLAEPALGAFVAQKFAEQAEAHYSYLWSHCSESEKVTLLALLGLSRQKPSSKTLPALESLCRINPRARLDTAALGKRGLVSERDGQWWLFSRSFGDWVTLEVTAPAEQQESPASVETWLAEGGRESLEPVKGALPRFKKKYWPILADVLKELSFEFIAGVVVSKLF
jgi:serine/threonine-protein kinase